MSSHHYYDLIICSLTFRLRPTNVHVVVMGLARAEKSLKQGCTCFFRQRKVLNIRVLTEIDIDHFQILVGL